MTIFFHPNVSNIVTSCVQLLLLSFIINLFLCMSILTFRTVKTQESQRSDSNNFATQQSYSYYHWLTAMILLLGTYCSREERARQPRPRKTNGGSKRLLAKVVKTINLKFLQRSRGSTTRTNFILVCRAEKARNSKIDQSWLWSTKHFFKKKFNGLVSFCKYKLLNRRLSHDLMASFRSECIERC